MTPAIRHLLAAAILLTTSEFVPVACFHAHWQSSNRLTNLRRQRGRQPNVAFVYPRGSALHMAESGDNDFWNQQRALMNEMSERTEKSLRKEQLEKYRRVQGKLVEETAFVSALIFSLLWLGCDNPFVPFSYVFGAVFGLAYTYGLGKYVETLGGTADDASQVQGAGVGQARFAFLILLFIFVGKLRAYGLIEIPSILGFFTYQISSLFQGLREDSN